MRKLDSRVRVGELEDVSARILMLHKQEAILQTDSFLNALFGEVQILSSELNAALKREVEVFNLASIDKKRDAIVRNLGNALLGYKSLPLLELSEPAAKLHAVYLKYGSRILKENYASGSVLIVSLLQELSVIDMVTAAQSLMGVSELIESLKVEQERFSSVRLEQEKAQAAFKNTQSASKAKKPLLYLLNKKLVAYLSAMEMANEGVYGKVVRAIDQIFENANTTVRRRSASKAAASSSSAEKTSL